MSILLWHRRPASESGRLCRDAGGAPAWRNVTPKLTSDVVVTAESTKRIVYGARRRASPWSHSVPRADGPAPTEIRQGRACPARSPFDLTMSARVPLVCWGVMPRL